MAPLVWEKLVWEMSRVGKVQYGKCLVWEKSVWEMSRVGKVQYGKSLV